MIEIARRTGYSKPYLRARIGLAFLAPDLQAAILEGRQPASLSVAQLIRDDLPMDWAAQRRLFGVI
jgi:site-specific DNA recombinase